jgi:hypothetical protein
MATVPQPPNPQILEHHLAKKPLPAQQIQELSPAALLQIALSHQAGIDVIERLAVLCRENAAREAEVAFNESLSRAQAAITRIAPDLTNPQTQSQYASYPALDRIIRPIYTREGLNLSFDTDDSPLELHVRVVCWVSLGSHTRKYKIDVPCDGKGARGGDVMSKTHAVASAVSYGMRYLLKCIFNLAIGRDDDGNAAGGGVDSRAGISHARREENCMKIANAPDMKKLFGVYAAAYREAQSAKDRGAMDTYIAAKDARKAELR